MLQTLEISLAELFERVRAGQIPLSARAQVTYDDAASTNSTSTGAMPEAVPDLALTLLEQWGQEDDSDDSGRVGSRKAALRAI